MSVLDEGNQILEKAATLTGDMLGVCRDELLTSFKFVNRPLSQLPARIQMERAGCMTNGQEALFSPAFVIENFGSSRQVITRAYLHMLVHCLLRHPFPAPGVDPLTWSVAADLACACVLSELECPQIELVDSERDSIVSTWAQRVESPTASAFYAVLVKESLSQEELANIEISVGMDNHEPWFDSIDGVEQQDSEDRESEQELEKHWEEVANATQIDSQRDDSDAPSTLTDQLRSIRKSMLSLDELLQIYAAWRESMKLSDSEFDYVYYTYGLRELGDIALVEPLEYCEDPQLRNFCIAIDTSGSCSGPLARAFVAKACTMLLESDSITSQTRVWLVQCDNAIQSKQLITSREQASALLDSFEIKGLGGTDFRPVFDWMDEMAESGEVPEWEALFYFTDGNGTFPEQAPPYDTAFIFVDNAGPCPQWATSALTFTDELETESER